MADVYIECLSPSNRVVVALLEKLTTILEEGKKGLLFTRVSEGVDHDNEKCRLLITEEGESAGKLIIGTEDVREICEKLSIYQN